MKQIFQSLSNGKIFLEELPVPKIKDNTIIISTNKSVVSAGTERMLIEFGKANYLTKARQQPDKVKEVFDKIKTDGILSTIETVKSKLDQPIPLGYCNVGVVTESKSKEFKIGDRVISNGPHAEFVRVSENLCTKVPDNIDDDTAVFTVLAAIGLQAIRLTNPKLGDKVVVSGLGLVGLLTVQMLVANGCDVLAIDNNQVRCDAAKSFGAKAINLMDVTDITSIVGNFSLSRGVDSVIIAASSNSDEIIHQSAIFCRQRGKITLVGDVGLNLRRDDFYKKEIKFQVSSSYGPGRYDFEYEEKGKDYPFGFVRWTSKRNFEAVLDMMKKNLIKTSLLISQRFKIEDFDLAYNDLGNSNYIGTLIDYNENLNSKKTNETIILINEINKNNEEKAISKKNSQVFPVIGCVGAGNYASKTLLPAFKIRGIDFNTIVSTGSLKSLRLAKEYNFNKISTNFSEILNNKVINTVIIATNHNEHASEVVESLHNKKNIFVEKPLCLNKNELSLIEEAYKKSVNIKLMVGFNRRFSPLVSKVNKLLKYKDSPKSIIYTVNAGYIPKEHWVHNSLIGGGRIIGEVCHFIDLIRFIVGCPILSYKVSAIRSRKLDDNLDTLTISLLFTDGSIGTIHYFSNGHKSYNKEKIEIFCENSILKLDNFKSLKGYGIKGFKKKNLWKQDKGHKDCVLAFIDSIKNNKESPIPFNELTEVTALTIDIAESLWEK